MSPWAEWKQRNIKKQEQGIVTPMALLNPDSPRADAELQEKRLKACEECPFYLFTKQCSKCGCHMPTKTTLLNAVCPEGVW